MNKLSNLITAERITFLKGTTKSDVLSEMVELISTSDKIQDKNGFLNAIHEREEIMSTGIGLGIAVPHAKIATVTDLVMAIGISKEGIDYQALDDQPVYIVVMIGASENQQNEYIRTLARVTLLLKNPRIRERIREATDTSTVFSIITDY